MWTNWIDGEWAKGRFFLMATLLTALEASGYLDLLPTLLKLVLLADVCGLLVVSVYQQGRSLSYRLVVLGLIITGFVSIYPAVLIPATPSLLVTLGFWNWGEVLFALGTIVTSIGATLYGYTKLLLTIRDIRVAMQDTVSPIQTAVRHTSTNSRLGLMALAKTVA